MKKILVLLLSLFILASCTGGGDLDDEGDGRIIQSGTTFADFKGHKNSLEWLKGTFSDSTVDVDRFVFTDTTVRNDPVSDESENTGTIYTYTKITYFEEETELTDESTSEKITAPAGSWRIEAKSSSGYLGFDYIIIKVSNDEFYFPGAENYHRKRVK